VTLVVVVVGELVVVVPANVDVVDVLDVVVVELEPVAAVTRSRGSARTTPTGMNVRAVRRSDARDVTGIDHEDNGSQSAAI
jgi:hypothetical protein